MTDKREEAREAGVSWEGRVFIGRIRLRIVKILQIVNTFIYLESLYGCPSYIKSAQRLTAPKQTNKQKPDVIKPPQIKDAIKIIMAQ